VRQNSDEQAALFNTEAVAARRHSTALALLPKTFDSLRAVFGHSGPSVLPLSQVRSPSYRRVGTRQSHAVLLNILVSIFGFFESGSIWPREWSPEALQKTDRIVCQASKPYEEENLRSRVPGYPPAAWPYSLM
jgi:hypothetical protein